MGTVIVPAPVQAQEVHLPSPGVMVHLSPEFNPPLLKGIKVHPNNPFQFEFILDKGDGQVAEEQELKQESIKLIKYFLASLTIPEKDLWVNLSPYEKDRIIPNSFGLTEMGRDLLAQDYMLKQITASLIYPEDEIGKKFWKRVYEEAAKKYHTTNIPVNTFNKVWIVPEKVVVYENAKAGTAYVVESKLKVLLEQDYLAIQKNQRQPGDMDSAVSPSTLPSETAMNGKATQSQSTNALGSQIVREIVLPELEKEVNQGKNFAQLRQVYNSLILATWYKKKIKDGILAKVYADKNKVKGIEYENSAIDTEVIYQQYLQAFKKGVYNYIKEEFDPVTQETIPRKYFSGGVFFDMDAAMTSNATAMRIGQLYKVVRTLPARLKEMFNDVSERSSLVRVQLQANEAVSPVQEPKAPLKISEPIPPTEQLSIELQKTDSVRTILNDLINLPQEKRYQSLSKLSNLLKDDPSILQGIDFSGIDSKNLIKVLMIALKSFSLQRDAVRVLTALGPLAKAAVLSLKTVDYTNYLELQEVPDFREDSPALMFHGQVMRALMRISPEEFHPEPNETEQQYIVRTVYDDEIMKHHKGVKGLEGNAEEEINVSAAYHFGDLYDKPTDIQRREIFRKLNDRLTTSGVVLSQQGNRYLVKAEELWPEGIETPEAQMSRADLAKQMIDIDTLAFGTTRSVLEHIAGHWGEKAIAMLLSKTSEEKNEVDEMQKLDPDDYKESAKPFFHLRKRFVESIRTLFDRNVILLMERTDEQEVQVAGFAILDKDQDNKPHLMRLAARLDDLKKGRGAMILDGILRDQIEQGHHQISWECRLDVVGFYEKYLNERGWSFKKLEVAGKPYLTRFIISLDGSSRDNSMQAASLQWFQTKGIYPDFTSQMHKLPSGGIRGGSANSQHAKYRDDQGNIWMYKTTRSVNLWHRMLIDQMAEKLALKLGLPNVVETKVGLIRDSAGQHQLGTFSRWIDTDENNDTLWGNLNSATEGIENLNREQLITVVRQHAFDWLVSNHDAHAGQFLKDRHGKVWPIDQSQAYKFMGGEGDPEKIERLDLEYNPNGEVNGYDNIYYMPIYNLVWKGLREGRFKSELTYEDAKALVFEVIGKIEVISDEEFTNDFGLQQYAEFRFDVLGKTNKEKLDRNTFLQKAKERKQDIRKDFEGFFQRVDQALDADTPKFIPQIDVQKRLSALYTAPPDMVKKIEEAGSDFQAVATQLLEEKAQELGSQVGGDKKSGFNALKERLKSSFSNRNGLMKLLAIWVNALRNEHQDYHRVYLARDAGFFHMQDQVLSQYRQDSPANASGSSVYYLSSARMSGESQLLVYGQMKRLIGRAEKVGSEKYPNNKEEAYKYFLRELQRLFKEEYRATTDSSFRQAVDLAREEMKALGYFEREKVVFVDTGFLGTIPYFLMNALELERDTDLGADNARTKMAVIQPSYMPQFSSQMFGFSLSLFSEEEQKVLKDLDDRFGVFNQPGSEIEGFEGHPVEFDQEQTWQIAYTSPSEQLEYFHEQLLAVKSALDYILGLNSIEDSQDKILYTGIQIKKSLNEYIVSHSQVKDYLVKEGLADKYFKLPEMEVNSLTHADLIKEYQLVYDNTSSIKPGGYAAPSFKDLIPPTIDPVNVIKQVKDFQPVFEKEFIQFDFKEKLKFLTLNFFDSLAILTSISFNQKLLLLARSVDLRSAIDKNRKGLLSQTVLERVNLRVINRKGMMISNGESTAPFIIDRQEDGKIDVYVSRELLNEITSRDDLQQGFAATLEYLLRYSLSTDYLVSEDALKSRLTTLGIRFEEVDGFYKHLRSLDQDGKKIQISKKGTKGVFYPKKLGASTSEAKDNEMKGEQNPRDGAMSSQRGSRAASIEEFIEEYLDRLKEAASEDTKKVKKLQEGERQVEVLRRLISQKGEKNFVQVLREMSAGARSLENLKTNQRKAIEILQSESQQSDSLIKDFDSNDVIFVASGSFIEEFFDLYELGGRFVSSPYEEWQIMLIPDELWGVVSNASTMVHEFLHKRIQLKRDLAIKEMRTKRLLFDRQPFYHLIEEGVVEDLTYRVTKGIFERPATKRLLATMAIRILDLADSVFGTNYKYERDCINALRKSGGAKVDDALMKFLETGDKSELQALFPDIWNSLEGRMLNRVDIKILNALLEKSGNDTAMKTKSEPDGAIIAKRGGIDLTPDNMNLQTQNSGDEIKFHMDSAMLAQLQNSTGFKPVILDIQPMTNLKEFLEVQTI